MVAQPGKLHALCLLCTSKLHWGRGWEQRQPRKISTLERCLVGIQAMEIW